MRNYREIKQHVQFLALESVASAADERLSSEFKDIYRLIMSDRQDARQVSFLLKITQILSVSERQILLNGLAREYTTAEDWLSYCEMD